MHTLNQVFAVIAVMIASIIIVAIIKTASESHFKTRRRRPNVLSLHTWCDLAGQLAGIIAGTIVSRLA